MIVKLLQQQCSTTDGGQPSVSIKTIIIVYLVLGVCAWFYGGSVLCLLILAVIVDIGYVFETRGDRHGKILSANGAPGLSATTDQQPPSAPTAMTLTDLVQQMDTIDIAEYVRRGDGGSSSVQTPMTGASAPMPTDA